MGAAVRACAATVVLVSPEVGLAPVALTPAGRRFVDALGADQSRRRGGLRRGGTLVIAGNAVPVKGGL